MRSFVKRVSFLFVLFCVGFWSYGQELKTIRGTLVSDSLDVSAIHVVNKTSGATTITNSKGVFRLGAQVQDTLVFSAVHIQFQTLILNQEVFEQPELFIYIQPVVNELREVVVKPHDLSGNLLDDMAQSPPPPINFSDVGIPGFTGTRKEKITYSSTGKVLLSALLIPLSPFDIEGMYKQISGYNKRLKQQRFLSAQFQSVGAMISFYGPSFLMNQYNIDEDEVYPFVLGCVENHPTAADDFKNGHHQLVMKTFDKYKTQTITP